MLSVLVAIKQWRSSREKKDATMSTDCSAMEIIQQTTKAVPCANNCRIKNFKQNIFKVPKVQPGISYAQIAREQSQQEQFQNNFLQSQLSIPQ